MDILEHFRHARRMEAVPQGTTLFRTGDAADFMYVLMEGQAKGDGEYLPHDGRDSRALEPRCFARRGAP
jgi:hypothetical protein